MKKNEKKDHKKIIDVLNRLSRGEKVSNISSIDYISNTSMSESGMSSVRSSVMGDGEYYTGGGSILGYLGEKVEDDKGIEASNSN